LWQAAFKIAGSKQATIKLLENPDALLKYPEILAIMNAQESTESVQTSNQPKEDDWESSNTLKSVEAGVSTLKLQTVSLNSNAPVTVSTPVGDGDDIAILDDTPVAEVDPREHLNIVFIGHVDAGKSTLSGAILYCMGKVDKRTIEKFEREAKQRNRESWFLAYILDESEEERAKGITIEVGRAHFETEVYRYTILDAPGHKNYVPNMIAGAAQADIGILVISARKGEFETGFEKGGQTREHALLAKTLGVQYLVVVVNKMDDPTVEWDVSRYEECVGKLKPYLKSCGYTIKTSVKFLPIAGLHGDNILREVSPDKCPWWKGMYATGAHNTTTPTLLSTLDSLKIAGRNSSAPLRIPCLDRYFERGCVVMGKVESGTISRGEEIAIAPTKKKAKVEAIIIDDKSVSFSSYK
jgi:peptide chain release factor subunit 3